MASTSVHSQQQDLDGAFGKIQVTILASEWRPSKGGLSTLIIRELAIQLAKFPEVEITVFLPRCSEEDKSQALENNVTIFEVKRRPGFDELDWLCFPPEDLQIDVIVGFGKKLGHQAQVIKEVRKCKLVHVVHSELWMFKSYPRNPILNGQEEPSSEVELCPIADLIVVVGPKLCESFRAYHRSCGKDHYVVDFTPGVFDEFASLIQISDVERKQCNILVFGCGDDGYFELKGLDIVGKAVSTLVNSPRVIVVAPDGTHEKIAEQFSACGVPESLLRVRNVQNCENLKRLFLEVDLVLMPSRTEGFGLGGLEALSAGLPVLVSENSGFGEALSEVPFGSSFVISSEYPGDWGTAIRHVWDKDRRVRLEEAKFVRSSYEKKYSWAKQSRDLLDKMISLVRLPSYVAARGPTAVKAFKEAKKNGTTLDTRVKVMLIGQDRVGKTSVARSLNGEVFRANETSTDGVQMHAPMKNPGNQPWKNCAMKHETSSYHHRCADYISREVQSMSQGLGTESLGSSNLNAGSDNKQKNSPSAEEESQANFNSQIDTSSGLFDDEEEDEVTARFNSHSSRDKKQEKENPFSNELVGIDSKIADLTAEKLQKKEFDNPDGIWPVIWDFAGQALFRAIHPIFMSPEAVYVLVWDPTSDLFATAQCKVNEDGCGEVEVETADSCDTNLDHILRWLDMVHSLRPSNDNCELPPVILVATHADETGCTDEKRKELETYLRTNSKEFYKHVVKSMAINNKLAGTQIQGKEDRRIVELRDKILEEARKLPHTRIEVPLKWLEVENKVYDHAKEKKEKYMTKQRFKSEIVSKITQPDLDSDLEQILNFMHDRGAVVYLDNPENQDGLVVLDPQWLVNDVLCKIITVRKQVGDNSQIELHRDTLKDYGILHPALLNYACQNLKLDDIKNDLIFLMKKFNLLCECKKDTIGESVYLVPCMLTREPEESLKCEALSGCEPVFITFDTSYVPFGLFSRILLLFSEWAASRTSCEGTELLANAASFVVTKESYLSVAFVCYKTVIKIPVLEWDPSNSTHNEREVLLQVSSVLTQILERLKQECRWLRGVSWKLCGQCKLCLGGRGKTKKCFWHKEPKCSHEDCTHYVSIRNKPFVCQNRKEKLFASPRIPQTWIQTLETDTGDIARPCASSRSSEGFTVLARESSIHRQRRVNEEDITENLETKAKVAKCVDDLGSTVKKGTPSDEELEGLSRRIPEHWRTVGRRLIKGEAQLTAFDLENPSCSEKAYKMLLFWKQSKGAKGAKAASYKVLFNALCHELVQLTELAEEFCCD